MKNAVWYAASFFFFLATIILLDKQISIKSPNINRMDKYPFMQEAPREPFMQDAPKPETKVQYQISEFPLKFLQYNEIQELMQRWSREASKIAEFGIYGYTSQGTPCCFLRVGSPGKPKILIHAGIHGNERLSMAATLWMVQKMLHDYNRDESVTWLIENRDIYWVPVMSPDTYLKSRHVENKDPNRDYPYKGRSPHKPTSPVLRMMEFVEKHNFTGVISGHTTGNIYFYPSICTKNDEQIHKKLAEEMGHISGYRNDRISSSPNGYEIDWYYQKGAVAILTEFGSGGHDQPESAIEPHASKNYKAYMHFIKQVPDLKISPQIVEDIDMFHSKKTWKLHI